jgi:hypothetical protein
MRSKYPKVTVGAWSWSPELLHSKIQRGAPDECWGWTGSVSPHANLFGARKNGRPQMTQATRILISDLTGQDIENMEVRHTCGNRFCTNPAHMYTQPNHMRYHKTGELLGTKFKESPAEPEPPPKLGEIKPLTDREWWEL